MLTHVQLIGSAWEEVQPQHRHFECVLQHPGFRKITSPMQT